jgi:hypothetical protein
MRNARTHKPRNTNPSPRREWTPEAKADWYRIQMRLQQLHEIARECMIGAHEPFGACAEDRLRYGDDD